jgi:hypothetical protein
MANFTVNPICRSEVDGRVPLAIGYPCAGDSGWIPSDRDPAVEVLKGGSVLPNERSHGSQELCICWQKGRTALVRAKTEQRSALSDHKHEDGEDAGHQQQ